MNPDAPAKLTQLMYQTWQNRFPASDPMDVTDYGQLFGGTAGKPFEGLIDDGHWTIAVFHAARDYIANNDLDLYPEDPEAQAIPEVIAEAVNRCVTAIGSLYGMQGEPITPATGPYPRGMRVNYCDGRYWQGEVVTVNDFGIVNDGTMDPAGAIWTHGLPEDQLAYLLQDSSGNEFWCNQADVLPEGK